MTYNKVYAQIGEERHIVLDPINYQYDIKQILVLTGETVPDYYEADVCNVGDTATLTMVGTAADGVEIPDKFLLDGRNVLVYVVIPGSGGDVQTRYDITIPVDERAEREDIDPSEAEQQQIDSLVAALNSGVGRAETAATEAEGSASNAAGHATDAEAWAAGQRAGTDVGTEDPTYHNNAKYYAGMAEAAAEEAGQHEASWETWVQRAETAAGNAEGSATAAGQSKTDAEAAAKTATQKAAAADASATEAENSASEAAQTVDGGVGAINAARDGALTAIGQAGTTQVNAVNQAGAAQVTAVNQAGTTQVQAVENKGAEVLDSIPQDYSDLVDDVDGLYRHLSDVEENQIPEFKSAIQKDEGITKTSGILAPPFERGNISYTTTDWGTYTNSNSRVRVPSGSEVELNGGDIIYCDSSIVAYYSGTADNSKWTVRGWFTGQIVVPFSGKYSFLLRKSIESTISDITDVTSKFAIFSGGMSSIFYDTSNFVNIIGLENAINRSYIKYSTGEEVFTGSNIFTRKFSNPVFKRLKAFCTSIDAVPAAIGLYSTTTAESASYISGVNFNNNSANGFWYMVDVPENCKLVTVTSRSDGNPVIILANAEILSDKIVESYYNKPSFFVPAKPRIVKHGGDSAIAPENSLPLFNLAGRSGYWGIETDIRQTSDKVLVCMHDATIDRTTTGTGAVASMTYEDLQNYTIDIGDYTEYTAEELRVPTFEEYLKVCRKYGCVAIIELYSIGYGTRVIDTIKKMGMEDSCVILSFDSNIGVDVRTWSKKIPFIRLYTTGTTLTTADVDSLPLNSGFAVGADANGDVATYSQDLLDYARTNNRYIGVWTINAGNIEKWEDAGLDMITVYSKS